VAGPALLVRKGYQEKVSLSASYYVDNVSSASIDVITTASPYREKRDEYSASIDYLHRSTLLGLSFTTSDEPDYTAEALGLSFAQEMFGSMTTFSLGYVIGRDRVFSSTDNSFADRVDRYQFQLGWSQVVTKTFVVTVNFEAIDEDGYLNSPYRAALIVGAPVPEQYPRVRTSQALAVRAKKAWRYERRGWNAALLGEYRFFRDNWEIDATTLGLGYEQYLGRRWLGDLHYRYYTQSRASFYSDDFTAAQTFMARDKELSTFKSHTVGGKLSYVMFDRRREGGEPLRSSVNLSYDYMKFDYDDFTDIRTGRPYSFGANVVQLFLSVWY
jgi:hypothetical protein